MLILLLILIVIACCLLVVIILAQNPKGGGLSNIGAGASQFLGARQTADFLEKSTWYFGIGILVVVIFTYFLTTGSPDSNAGQKSRTEGVEYNGSLNAPKKPEAKTGPEQPKGINIKQGTPPAPNAGGGNPPPPPIKPGDGPPPAPPRPK